MLAEKDLIFNLRVISAYPYNLVMSVPLDFVDISTTKNAVVFVCRNRSSCAKSGPRMVPSVTVGACQGLESKLESILKGLQ